MWQQRDLHTRALEYVGNASLDSEDRASINDILPMGGFSLDIHVSAVMNTESDFLCYRY